MGEYQKARKELETTSEMKELDSEAYALLGIACLKLKDNNNARKYFEQALKKNPANEIALKELENCN
jgi:Flp pilus assembly protein TadD